MDSARPNPVPTRARNRLRARYTPTASSRSTVQGSTRATASRALYADWARTSVSALVSATVGCTSGTRLTAVSPAWLSRCLARSMNGARSRYTVSPRTTIPLLSPDSTAFIWLWAVVMAWFHTDANCGLATSSAILPWTKPVTADVRVGVRVLNRVVICGGSPWLPSAVTASSAIPFTSTYWNTVAVSRLVRAFWMSGSSTSGLIVRTKRSVFETWLWIQTETPATGARTQPRTISTTASNDRQRNFCRDGGAAV